MSTFGISTILFISNIDRLSVKSDKASKVRASCMNIQKKYINVVVFSCISLLIATQPVMLWWFLKHQQYLAYQQMQSNIRLKHDIKDVFTISIPAANIKSTLRWKNDHEFYKDGYICDVVDCQLTGDFMVIDYIHDKKETQIELKIKDLGATNGNKGMSLSKKRSNPFQMYYCLPGQSMEAVVSQQLIRSDYCQVSYQSIDLIPRTPPPDWC